MDNCVFCKIVKGEIQGVKIWEDDDFLSFLDINPAVKGMTLVIPKKHLISYVFENESSDIHKLMDAAKEVAKTLKNSLKPATIAAVFEGLEAPHLHIKLYPLQEGQTLHLVLKNPIDRPTHEELVQTASEIILNGK